MFLALPFMKTKTFTHGLPLFIVMSFSFTGYRSDAQNYIDTLYKVKTQTNIEYGNSLNFAGTDQQLLLDFTVPEDDQPPVCGRPLVVIVHGGAWIAGSKDDAGIKKLRNDFAKRGYAAAAINYRLGFFYTNQNLNCNIPNWRCLLAADTSEWVRAWFRGVQDAKAAIRFLVLNKAQYAIDANQVFVYGESAGGFIALGVGYLDDADEKPVDCMALNTVQAPNQAYFIPCISKSSWSQEIQTMKLSRPDLGSIDGDLHSSAGKAGVKAIANMFGGMLINLFEKSDGEVPDLYTFHQPNDLIVPIGKAPLLRGFSDCAVATGCIGMPNRPLAYGSEAISNYLKNASIPSSHKPEVQLEITANNADCITQVLDPSKGGHQYDNYYLRSSQAAQFFAKRIQPGNCSVNLEEEKMTEPISVHANGRRINVKGADYLPYTYRLINVTGQLIAAGSASGQNFEINTGVLPGLYWLVITHTAARSGKTYPVLLSE